MLADDLMLLSITSLWLWLHLHLLLLWRTVSRLFAYRLTYAAQPKLVHTNCLYNYRNVLLSR